VAPTAPGGSAAADLRLAAFGPYAPEVLNVGTPELLVILLVALLVLGPDRLPDAARQVGKVMGDLRRMSSGFQRELQAAMKDGESDATGPAEPKPFLGDQPPLAPAPDEQQDGPDETSGPTSS
jgi:Tat protein translocase TatB subunit